MGQVTAKTVEDALSWIDSHEHHEAGLHWAKGRSKETGCYEFGEETHMRYKGHGNVMLVPLDIFRRARKYIVPNQRQFDSRMFAITPAAKRMLARSRALRS